MSRKLKRSLTVKHQNKDMGYLRAERQQSPNETANSAVEMVSRVDFVRELKNNDIFRQQRQKLRSWERRKSASLEDLRIALASPKPVKELSRSDAAITDIRNSKKLAAGSLQLHGRLKNVSRYFCDAKKSR